MKTPQIDENLEQAQAQENVGEEDREDLHGDYSDLERRYLDDLPPETLTQKGEMEKLARFFSLLPGTDEVKKHFFGFIAQQQQYTFYESEDMRVLMMMYTQTEAEYINSLHPWDYTPQTNTMLANIKTLFYSIVRGSIGTKHEITNQRTALNKLSINRTYGDTTPRRRGGLSGFFGSAG